MTLYSTTSIGSIKNSDVLQKTFSNQQCFLNSVKNILKHEDFGILEDFWDIDKNTVNEKFARNVYFVNFRNSSTNQNYKLFVYTLSRVQHCLLDSPVATLYTLRFAEASNLLVLPLSCWYGDQLQTQLLCFFKLCYSFKYNFS